MSASLVKLLQNNFLFSDMYAGPVPHNQTCVIVNMSADPVAWMPGQLVGRKHNRHAHWPNVTRTDMPADLVQQYPAFLLVGFN